MVTSKDTSKGAGHNDINNAVTGLKEVRLGGGSIVHNRPCFSEDSKYLFVVSDGGVCCYSTASGELSRRLQADRPVVDAVPDPSNPRHIASVDAEGTVTVWDAALGVSLQKHDFTRLTRDGSSVVGLLAAFGSWYLLLQRLARPDSAELLRPAAGEESRPQLLVEGVRRGVAGRWEVKLGDHGRMVAAVTAPNMVLVRNIWQKAEPREKLYNTLRTDASRPFTCVSCHPGQPLVAAGDASGRLLLFRDLLSRRPPVRTVLHWHTLPLPSVAVSTEGTYLLTGGEESVLVWWHLHDEKPSFLPRLGMPIRHVTVSPDNQLIATSHADNVVRVISARREVVQQLRGLCWGAADAPAAVLVPDLRTGGVLLNSTPGQLQLFCPHTKRDLYSVDIVQTNLVPRERSGAAVQCDVTRVAVSGDGRWMATVEERDDASTVAERRLKFWRWDDATQSHVLNTNVEDPHDGAVTALLFRPGKPATAAPLAVTTATDGHLKYWSLVDDSDIYGSRHCWSCDAVGQHRRQLALCAGFSADGNQLAVGFGSAVTLWQPDSNTLLNTLSCAALRDDVRQLEYGRGSCCGLLVSRTDSGLRVWSLDLLTLVTRIDLRVTLLTADPHSEYMAAFSASDQVFVFRPSSSRPVHRAALRSPVTAACFVQHRRPRPDLPDWQQQSQLVFLNREQALHTLDLPADGLPSVTSSDITDDVSDGVTSTVTTTPYSALVAQQRRSAVVSGEHSSRLELTPDLYSQLQMLEAPSHTLPPLTRLCSPFLESMLHHLPSESELEADSKMEAEPFVTVGAGTKKREPSLEARLNCVLAADMSWLTAACE